jgi:hypothetical protein
MAYDRLDDYPVADQPGVTHIGMFIVWAVNRDLHNSAEDDGINDELVAAVRAGDITGTALLITLDGKFWESELGDEGNAFARSYYASGEYVADFADLFGELVGVPETPENQRRLSEMLDRRYERFVKPPFWAFWRRG